MSCTTEKDYDTAYISAEYEHETTKSARANRRRKAALIKQKQKNVSRYSRKGYYVKNTRPIYRMDKLVIEGPLVNVYKEVDIYDSFTGNWYRALRKTGVEKAPDTVILKRRFLGYENCKPYLKRYNKTSRRNNYNKSLSNTAVRQYTAKMIYDNENKDIDDEKFIPGSYKKLTKVYY